MAGFVGIICVEIFGCLINNTFAAMAGMTCFDMRSFSDGLRLGTFLYVNEVELRSILVLFQDLGSYLAESDDLYIIIGDSFCQY